MFERRLKVLLWVMGVVVAVLIARLAQLQIVQADIYRKAAHEALLRPPRVLPCTRGRILDRTGKVVLAEDAPCWDVCVPYRILAGDRADHEKLANELKAADPNRHGQATEAEVDALQRQIDETWPAIAKATNTPLYEVALRRERIVARVRAIKDAIRKQFGVDRRIAEEDQPHPVVRGLDHATKIKAEIALAWLPWVQVTGSTTRRYSDDESMAHLLGHLEDPGLDQVFRQDFAPELRGVSGLEELGEDKLRGVRGTAFEDIERDPVAPPIMPKNGEDIRTTVDAGLQHRIYERLAQTVDADWIATGAAAVVIDLPSREVLALVSYPGYKPNPTPRERRVLALDRKSLPLRFRPVAQNYPPGSIVKPLVATGGLTDGIVDENTTVNCQHWLDPERRDAFTCLGYHGPIAVRQAITKSCNIYFYQLGDRLGVSRLSHWFSEAGFGSPSGTGLDDEIAGRLPTERTKGNERNAGVGQGQVEVSPIQAANMMATIAMGSIRPVTLLRDDDRDRPTHRLDVSPETWRLVRSAMYDVVNTPGGTAYGKAAPPPRPWVLFGKTGSAEPWRRQLDRVYVCEWADGRREEFIATDTAQLRERLEPYGEFHIVGTPRTYRYWPPPEVATPPTHAWFAGFMMNEADAADLARTPRRAVAIAVVVEYAGGGGSVAGPIAGDIAKMILDVWPD